jgi:hypothetical protein
MIAYLLVGITFALIGIWSSIAIKERDEETVYFMIILSVVSLIFLTPVIFSWDVHADDLGTIAAQDHVISVFEQRRTALTATIKTFKYPEGSLLNADSPVKAIVDQLAEVEKALGDARNAKAKAMVNIEQRRVGPMSAIIDWVGDYK